MEMQFTVLLYILICCMCTVKTHSPSTYTLLQCPVITDRSDNMDKPTVLIGDGCYWFQAENSFQDSWKDSSDWCRSQGGRLVKFETKTEENDVIMYINSQGYSQTDRFWTSGKCPYSEDNVRQGVCNNHDNWTWIIDDNLPGDVMSYSSWYPGEPNPSNGNPCMILKKADMHSEWAWYGYRNDEKTNYICEYEPLNTTTTTIAATTTTTVTVTLTTPIQQSTRQSTTFSSSVSTNGNTNQPSVTPSLTQYVSSSSSTTPSDSTTASLTVTAGKNDSDSSGLWIGLGVGLAALLVLILLALIFIILKRRKRNQKDATMDNIEMRDNNNNDDDDDTGSYIEVDNIVYEPTQSEQIDIDSEDPYKCATPYEETSLQNGRPGGTVETLQYHDATYDNYQGPTQAERVEPEGKEKSDDTPFDPSVLYAQPDKSKKKKNRVEAPTYEVLEQTDN